MLYKTSIHHEDGMEVDRYSNDFETAVKLGKEEPWAYCFWVTEFQLEGNQFKSTHKAWDYQRINDAFKVTEHHVF